MKLKEMIEAFVAEGYEYIGYDKVGKQYMFRNPERFGPYKNPVSYHTIWELRFWMKRDGPPIRGNPWYPRCKLPQLT